METPSTTREQFSALMRSEYERYGKLVASLGLKAH
jgi:hypothetical protein